MRLISIDRITFLPYCAARKKALPLKLGVLCWIATAGPVGRMPVAPGTFGTLAAIPLALSLKEMSPPTSVLVLTAFLGLAWLSAREKLKGSHTNDPGEIVIDEMAGFLVSTWLLSPSWPALILAFFCFRFYDILKPFPVSFFDQSISGGLGVVMDDIVAGLYTNITVRILLWLSALLF